MMDIKKVIDDIKNQIRAEDVKNKIASDLGLKLDKSNKCLCFNHNEKVPSMGFDMKSKKIYSVILLIFAIVVMTFSINKITDARRSSASIIKKYTI